MTITDITAPPYTLASNLPITPTSTSVTINTKTFTNCLDTQQWRSSVKDIQNTTITSGVKTTIAYYAYYYGLCTVVGPSGSGRPSAASISVAAGNKVIDNSAIDIPIPFNSGVNDYLWFALPASVPNKNCWVQNPSINGPIAGAVGGTNIFPALTPADVVSVTNSFGCTTNYNVYISNRQSVAPTLTIRLA
jgi:hypothetical protein